MEFQIGMLVESRAGHDKGSLYIITGMDAQYVYLCDGRIRTTERPKRKKYKHIAKKSCIPEQIEQKLIEQKPVENEDIKRVIKVWRSENVKG